MIKNGEYKNCLNCNNVFYAKRKNIIHKDKGKYCSKKCFYENRKTLNRIIVNCEVCNEEIETLKSRLRTCCSRKCFYKSMIKNLKNPWFKADHSKEKSPTWKGGITPLHFMIRNSEKYINWRNFIFERDDFTCQKCEKKNCYVEAHHEKSFSIIFNEFLKRYNQFSPLEDKETLMRLAMSYIPFWAVSNGVTLCKKCHDKTKRKNYDPTPSIR